MSDTKQKSVLRQIGTATIPASTTPFAPNERLVSRQGLYVYDGFIARVRKHASPVESMGALTLPYSDLVEDAYDRDIGQGLGDGYEFSATKLCYVIDQLIARQPNGEEGDLLTNGYANLFYVEGGPVVDVGWGAGYRLWYVCDWHRDDRRWGRGYRAFRN